MEGLEKEKERVLHLFLAANQRTTDVTFQPYMQKQLQGLLF